MKLLFGAVLIVLLLSTVPLAFAEFSFHNEFSYADDTKVLHVLGELKNDSDYAMKNVLINISFYDNEGRRLDQFQRAPALEAINPRQSSSFEILYFDQQKVERVSNYTMSATGQAADSKEKQLKIVSSNSRLDLLGTYYVNAAARNDGPDDATNTIMVATLYDKDNRVIAIGKALAEAGPGSFNITADSEAPFGFSITDKLQTSRIAKYSLVVDSDQYTSDTVFMKTLGPSLSSGNQNKSGCLIATAAFGSELAPQVQDLRIFRDSIVLKTTAGSGFMDVFNAWYYSFSPSVANYESQTPWLQNIVRALIYPLLSILDISTRVYNLLAFNSELGIVTSGAVASSLISLFYFAPFGAAIGIISRKRRWNMSAAKRILALSWAASIVAIALSEVAHIDSIMMFGTSLLVLSALTTVMIGIIRTFKL